MRDFSTSGDDARIAPWHVPLDTVLGHDASESFFRWRRTRGGLLGEEGSIEIDARIEQRGRRGGSLSLRTLGSYE